MTSRRVSSRSVHRQKSFNISHKLKSAVEKAGAASAVLLVLTCCLLSRPAFAQSQSAVLKLFPNTHGPALQEAKQAFSDGRIVEMDGNHREKFDSLLDIALPPIDTVESTWSLSLGSRTFSASNRSLPTLEVTAAHLALDGLHVYECAAAQHNPFPPANPKPSCSSAFQKWVDEENNLQSSAFPLPEQGAWTSAAQISAEYVNDYQSFEDRVRIYRLNDISPNNDWYMIVRDPFSTPNYQGCVPFGACGWYTNTRDFQISLDRALLQNPAFKLYDWSPQQSIDNGTGELSLGLSLDSVVPKPGAGYSFSWPQQSVKTEVYSAGPQKEVSWVERFSGQAGVEPPPLTSTQSFLSHAGLIFQVPAGTESFHVNDYASLKVTYSAWFTEYWTDIFSTVLFVRAPEFRVDQTNLQLRKQSKATVYLISEFDTSSRLKWVVVSKPDWLDVSPTQGAGSSFLEIIDNGQAEVGNTGYVELQTDPAYGAPSVEAGPLRIKVSITQQTARAGVLLAGGRDANGQLLKTAEVWNPATGKSVVTSPMNTPRMDHTATRLLDGRILIAGGRSPDDHLIDRAEIFDPVTGTFTKAGSMHAARYDHTATLLTNGPLAGKVLVAGGCCDPSGNALASAELFDPNTLEWSETGSLHAARTRHAATALNSAQVLITGGASSSNSHYGLSTAEVYSQSSGTFTRTGNLKQPRQAHSATLLVNGQVLVAGGYSTPNDPIRSAELYTPLSGEFAFTGEMLLGRRYQAGALLLGGAALITGGWNSPETADLFNVDTGLFERVENPMSEYRDAPTATLIRNTGTQADGKVLVAGGALVEYSSSGGTGLDLYDPESKAFSSAGNMSTARTGLTATFFNEDLSQSK